MSRWAVGALLAAAGLLGGAIVGSMVNAAHADANDASGVHCSLAWRMWQRHDGQWQAMVYLPDDQRWAVLEDVGAREAVRQSLIDFCEWWVANIGKPGGFVL